MRTRVNSRWHSIACRLDRAGVVAGHLGGAAQGVLEHHGANLAAGQLGFEILHRAAVERPADQQAVALELQIRRWRAGGQAGQYKAPQSP